MILLNMLTKLCKNAIIFFVNASVAQLDRVLGYEPNGRGFESLRMHQKKQLGLVPNFFILVKLDRDSDGALRKQSSGLFLASGVIAALLPV